MVEYLDEIQRHFLDFEVAEGVQDKEAFVLDLKLARDKLATDEVGEAAEKRIMNEVIKHGVWIGHGDLLTMKMFYVAKSLRFVFSPI